MEFIYEAFGKCAAIVQFGPPTDTSGFRPAEYFQVTIDPNMASPSGEFIRFGFYGGDEIVGWQRVEAMTVCEVLNAEVKAEPNVTDGYTAEEGKTIVFRKAA